MIPPTAARLRLPLLAALVAIAMPALASGAQQDGGPYFSKDQASAGKTVYKNECSECHSGDLSGESGPALAGSKFADSLDYSGMSARQLYDFISEHMPKKEPGSLSDKEYREVFAYILCSNGFKPGDTALEDATLDKIKLLPLPAKNRQTCD